METNKTITIVAAESISGDVPTIRVTTPEGRIITIQMDFSAAGQLTTAVTAALQRHWHNLDDREREELPFGADGAVVASARAITARVDTENKQLTIETYGAPLGLSVSFPVSMFAEFMGKWQDVAHEISAAGLATVPPEAWMRPVISDGLPVPGTRVVTLAHRDVVSIDVSPPGGHPGSPGGRRLVINVDHVDALIASLAEGKAMIERQRAGSTN